jgi:membrane protease YdiL (CAAX protease family)
MGITRIEARRRIVYDAPAVPPAGFLALFPSLLVPLLLIAFPASVWPAVIAYHAWCLGVALAFAGPSDRHLPAIARHPYWFIAVITILAAIGAEVVARGYVDVRPWLPAQWVEVARRAMPWTVFASYSLVVHTYAEERFWREALLRQTTALQCAAAFGLMHFAVVWVLLGAGLAIAAGVGATLAGLVWGVAARRYQAIWPCVITHVAVDAAILRVAWALLPR